MKYITSLKTLLLAGLLAGCQPQDELLTDGQTLNFNVALEGETYIQTRAYGGDLKLADIGFGIAGYLTVGDFTANPGVAVPNMLSSARTMDDKALTDVPWIKLATDKTKFTVKLPTKGGTSNTEAGEKVSYFAWSGIKDSEGYGLIGATTPGTAGYPFIDVKLRRADGTQGDIVGAHALDFPNDYVVTAIDLDFHHLFSKLTFSVKNNTNAKVTITSTKLKFAKERIYSKARYTYDCSDSIGSFGRYSDYYADENFVPTAWKTGLDVTNAIATLGEMLILPQKASEGFLALELTYILASGISSSTITRTIRLKALDMRQGRNYLYTLNINAEQVEVINATVGKWNEAPTGSLPLVPGPCGDDILLLEGTDAPYLYDGKRYWLDRSGYNNHCELIEKEDGGVTYKKEEKGYSVNCSDGYAGGRLTNFIKIPQLGVLNSSTVEIIVTPGITDKNYLWAHTPLSLSQNPITNIGPGWTDGPPRDWLIHTYVVDNICFDYGSNIYDYNTIERLQSDLSFEKKRNTKCFFAFRRGPNIKTMMRNDSYSYSAQSIPEKNKRVLNLRNFPITVNNGAIAPLFKDGIIHYVKITKKCLSDDGISTDFAALKQQSAYNIPEDDLTAEPNKFLPAVRAGLILCLDGRYGVNTQAKTWSDISDYKHIAKYRTGSGSLAVASKAAVFDGLLLKLEESLGTHQEITLEVIIHPVFNQVSANGNTLLAFFSSLENEGKHIEGDRQLHVHTPWYTGLIVFNAPAFNQLSHDLIKAAYSKHHYSFKREMRVDNIEDILTIRIDNKQMATSTLTAVAVKELKYGYIGGQHTDDLQYFYGQVFTIRIYNRALTVKEQELNYEKDKTAFEL